MEFVSDESLMTTATPTSGIGSGANLLPDSPSALAPIVPVPPRQFTSGRVFHGDQQRTEICKNGVRRKPRNRHKAPKDSRIYKAAMATIALKAQGLKYDEIAEQLGLTKNTIITYLKRANREGWLNLESFSDAEDALEVVLKGTVIRNLSKVLNETDSSRETDISSPSNRAYEASLEIAKGTGLLKQHQVVKTDQQASIGVALRVQVEMPPANGTIAPPRSGSIGGQPAFDAEVIETEEL